jgi:hypothetical protein
LTTFTVDDDPPAKDVQLRYRSAPWDDILEEPSLESSDGESRESPDDNTESIQSYDTEQDLQDSPAVNLLPKRALPTHYKPLFVPALPKETTHILDPFSRQLLAEGASLPPPTTAPAVFVKTPPSPLMDEALQDLLATGFIQPDPTIVNAFRIFLVAKPDGSARAIMDLSAWTPHYSTPSMRLYSAAEVDNFTANGSHDKNRPAVRIL